MTDEAQAKELLKELLADYKKYRSSQATKRNEVINSLLSDHKFHIELEEDVDLSVIHKAERFLGEW